MFSRGVTYVEFCGKPESQPCEHGAGHAGVMRFEPKEAHGGRRVERFDTLAHAQAFVRRFKMDLFRIAEDLIAEEDMEAVRQVIDARLQPLQQAVEALEQQVAKMEVRMRFLGGKKAAGEQEQAKSEEG